MIGSVQKNSKSLELTNDVVNTYAMLIRNIRTLFISQFTVMLLERYKDMSGNQRNEMKLKKNSAKEIKSNVISHLYEQKVEN